MFRINIVGAGLAGLTAAVHLAEKGIGSNLISVQISERAQSVMAAGGINAAMDVSGESDTVQEHFDDTMRGGVYLADPEAVRGLTGTAPEIIRRLMELGVPFNMEGESLVQRHFGGQKKIRTAYARSSTGKALMTAMIDAARRYEGDLIKRFSRHRFRALCIEDGTCKGVRIEDVCTGEIRALAGPVILAFGGSNGMFPGRTTGTTANDGCALAAVFAQGVELANLEFIQYHPTTVQIPGKCMLISEAARGEGGRLFALRDGRPWYFMEELHPSLGNLMPRDVISREMALLKNEPGCTGEVCLDLMGLDEAVWSGKLSDLREEIIDYLHLDPKITPVPVSPGIHFFMGGIRVNDRHETNVKGLLAAGEAACKYHGANRLGGNSMLGAIFGGRTAAETAVPLAADISVTEIEADAPAPSAPEQRRLLREALVEGLGIVRTPEEMGAAQQKLERLLQQPDRGEMDRMRLRLGLAMVRSAQARLESRGAHYRLDYPETREDFRRLTIAQWADDAIKITFVPADVCPGGEEA